MGLWSVFLKCDINEFNGNWAESFHSSAGKTHSQHALSFNGSYNATPKDITTPQVGNKNINLTQAATLHHPYFQST